MKKTLLALSLAAILLVGCDEPTKNLTAVTSTLAVDEVSADTRHTMILDEDGNLYANGWNEDGALGDGISVGTTITAPTKVMEDVASIDTGYNFTMIVKEDGTLWGTGNNANGQLGIGSTADATSFTEAIDSNGNSMTNVASVYTGHDFTLALKNDGTLWATGANYHGELGLTDNTDRNVFTQVTGLGSTVSKVATGDYHSVILLSDGTLLTAGDNTFGQLGNNSTTNLNTFTSISNSIGTVSSMGANQAGTFIVNSSGEVYVAGDNWNGAIGTGATYANHTFTKLTGISNAVKVDGKYTSALIVTSSGELYYTGLNGIGQGGAGTTTQIDSFTKVVDSGVSTGNRQISTGDYTSFYVSTSNVLYGTGDNYFANLGVGTSGANTGYTVFTAVTE